VTTNRLPPVEPTAELRNAANGIRGTFVALVESGFSEDQALRLCSDMLRAHMPRPD
jgi:hypothetical protein